MANINRQEIIDQIWHATPEQLVQIKEILGMQESTSAEVARVMEDTKPAGSELDRAVPKARALFG